MNNITLKRTNSSDPDFRLLVAELDAELRITYQELMDTYEQHNVIEVIDTVVVTYVSGQPAGCACFKDIGEQTGEVKRMYVQPASRGLGISAMMLKELDNWALSLGFATMLLETGEKQNIAINLYTRSGYKRVDNYGPYVNLPTSLCFGKILAD